MPDRVLERMGGDTQHRLVESGKRGLGEIFLWRGRPHRAHGVAKGRRNLLDDTLLAPIEDKRPRTHLHRLTRSPQPDATVARRRRAREGTHLLPLGRVDQGGGPRLEELRRHEPPVGHRESCSGKPHERHGLSADQGQRQVGFGAQGHHHLVRTIPHVRLVVLERERVLSGLGARLCPLDDTFLGLGAAVFRRPRP